MQRIAVDMDEVMADAQARFAEWYAQDFSQSISVEALKGKHFSDVVPEAHQEKVKKYPSQKGFFADLPIMKDCQEVMRELLKKYEIFIVTAAMEFPNSFIEKYEWLHKYFPEIHWKNIVFCGDKSIVKADYLIDDHTKNLAPFSGKGIIYTASHNLYVEGFSRVDNWREIADMFL